MGTEFTKKIIVVLSLKEKKNDSLFLLYNRMCKYTEINKKFEYTEVIVMKKKPL